MIGQKQACGPSSEPFGVRIEAALRRRRLLGPAQAADARRRALLLQTSLASRSRLMAIDPASAVNRYCPPASHLRTNVRSRHAADHRQLLADKWRQSRGQTRKTWVWDICRVIALAQRGKYCGGRPSGVGIGTDDRDM